MTPQRIILIGYRGSGKTTVGRILARELGWEFADADEHLEAAAGRSIAAIFAAEGEPGFRDRESATLADLCRRDRLVIATGGGAVLRPANRELLREAGFVAWLVTDPETSWARLSGDPTTADRRPNLTPAGGFAEVKALIAARTPLYRDLAHFSTETDAQSPDAVANAILSACKAGTSQSSRSGAAGSSSSG
jgi:shikimate kinase